LQYWYSGMCTFIEIQSHGNMCLRVYSYTYKYRYSGTCTFIEIQFHFRIDASCHVS